MFRRVKRVTYTELCQSLAENSVQVFEWKLPPKLPAWKNISPQ